MKRKQNFRQSLICAIASDEVTGGFKKLYGSRHTNEKIIEYYTKKLKLSVAVLVAGIVLYFVFPYMKTPVLVSPYEINRNDYGGGSRTVSLEYRLSDGERRNLELNVNERKHTEAELEKIYETFEQELEKSILADNSSPDHVTKDLNFVSSIKEYPFSITYKTDNPALLSYSGKIDYSKISDSDGELVTIIITVRHEDFKREMYKTVNIFEKEQTKDERLENSFNKAIEKSDESSKYSENMQLPDEVNGIKIQYSEKGKKLQFIIPLLTVVFAAALLVGNNDELKKEIRKRDAELTAEYPVLINKFAIFYNAGMPVNVIWNKLCSEYESSLEKTGQRKYLYEEMLVTRTMMADGKNEIESYEDFAKRCGLRQYKVFVSLIQQAITKGKGDMAAMLKKEAEEAFTERKNNAKKLSEEASSKLLLPMFMMLIVVMIMIMFPAFNSFN